MITTHRATRDVKQALHEAGLSAVTGRVFSRAWDDHYGHPATTIRTVVYMVDPTRREDVIAALQASFDDITRVFRFDRDDSRATYCAVGILRSFTADPTTGEAD